MLRSLSWRVCSSCRAARARSVATLATKDRSGLKEAFAEKLPASFHEIQDVRTRFAEEEISSCTVAQAYGGMRGVTTMTYETSLLDNEEGIRFRGYTIPECQDLLPKAQGGSAPLPESVFWLLLTGDVPTETQIDALRSDLAARSRVPQTVLHAIDALPADLHPMTQFSIAVLAMQQQSIMAEEYRKGTSKALYWEHCFEDTMTILAQLPEVAARIYRRSFRDGIFIPSDAENLDMGANYARMMGFEDPGFDELVRLYLAIHTDHGGGNVSAHTIRLVGSALSDPFLSLSAGLNGLAGPLHGLAIQEVLSWTMDVKAKLGDEEATEENLTKLCWETLNSGKVIPGFGHAVLRKTDPRYTCLRQFALEHLPDDEMFGLVSKLSQVVPAVLMEQGKAKNPWPNVDAHTGILLQYYGLTEEKYYTVLFGVSRAIGPLASLIWDRALGLPIEHLKSVTTGWIKERFASQTEAAQV